VPINKGGSNVKDQIKQLREVTGAGMLDCKRMLDNTNGDMNQAIALLHEKMGKKVLAKQHRETQEGIVVSYIHSNQKMGAMVAVKCETDFVAKNKLFGAFAHDVALHISAMNPETVDELLTQTFVKDGDMTIGEKVNQLMAKMGENIVIGHFQRFSI